VLVRAGGYDSPMRSVSRYQLFLRAYPDAALQMRRLADLVVACVVLAATLPLALLVALAIKCDDL
jgi:lipopolysaccharide/colanic/teichoic acid biosynthesis glycosyltransferase